MVSYKFTIFFFLRCSRCLFVLGGKSEGRHENRRDDAIRRIPPGFSRHDRQLCTRYQLRADGHGDLIVLSISSVSRWCVNHFSASTLPSYARQNGQNRVEVGEILAERAIQEEKMLLVA